MHWKCNAWQYVDRYLDIWDRIYTCESVGERGCVELSSTIFNRKRKYCRLNATVSVEFVEILLIAMDYDQCNSFRLSLPLSPTPLNHSLSLPFGLICILERPDRVPFPWAVGPLCVTSCATRQHCNMQTPCCKHVGATCSPQNPPVKSVSFAYHSSQS